MTIGKSARLTGKSARLTGKSALLIGKIWTDSPDGKQEGVSLENISLQVHQADSLNVYPAWPEPTVIISDGAYGIAGFPGDTPSPRGLADWYRPHIEAWAERATAATTLWFWNTEVGWATVHPVLEANGWEYVHLNTWNKGRSHLAGRARSQEYHRFPVVSEVCVQYIFRPKIAGMTPWEWLLQEWKRTGLPRREANLACGVQEAASRKYLDQTGLWYPPPPETFQKLQEYANEHGRPEGRPYFAPDGLNPAGAQEWTRIAAHPRFECPFGITNVWDRPALRGRERRRESGGAVHPNQKPMDLTVMIIRASSQTGDTVWEPFGGLFTACAAARDTGRRSRGAEIDPGWFQQGVERLAGSKQLWGIFTE